MADTTAADVLVRNAGSVWLFCPQTQEALDWIEHNIGEAMYLGRNLVVEHRYGPNIVIGMRDDALVVEAMKDAVSVFNP